MAKSFQLRVLGGASLDGPEGPLSGRAAQRHRLALLALLAHAGARGLSREKLAGYLWAESPEQRARRLLSDSVYRINNELGVDAVVTSGHLLRLDEDALPTDLAAFRTAVEEEDWPAAVDAYGGPFLDGFHLPDAVAFERWVDDVRAALHDEHAGALEALATEAAVDGDQEEAASLWRRRAALDPYDARVALALMRALDAAGNRAAALRHARLHAQLLDMEFGAEPHPEVEALAETLRMAPAVSEAPAGAAPPPQDAPPTRAEAARRNVAGPASGTQVVVAVEGFPSASRVMEALRRRPPVAWAVLTLLAAVLAATWIGMRPGNEVSGAGQGGEPASPITLAVLPFDNLNGDEEGLFFTDGVTEDVLTRLSGVAGFSVIARASVMPYRASPRSVPGIADELGVRYVVHGSVRHGPDGLRITAQLVDARSNTNVWAQSYDRPLEELFAVQSDIAARVAAALTVRLTPRQAEDLDRAPTTDLEAYDAYLRGRFHWHLRTETGLRRAVEFFQDAVSRDPAFARAWAGLADAYAVLGFYDYLSPSDAFPRAREAALRALELDDRLPEAHASLGYVALYHDWNAEEAEASFRRSIALNPSYSTGHQWYANHLVATGRFDEAERAMNRARETNPLSLIATGALGWVYYYAGRFEAALRQCDLALEMDPSWDLAHLWRGLALERTGRFEEALASLERAVALSGGSGITVAALAQAQASAGDAHAARAALAGLASGPDAGGYRPSFDIAKVYVALGDDDEALRWLERAYQERSHSMVFLEVDPQLAPLRRLPGFQALVARVGLGAAPGG